MKIKYAGKQGYITFPGIGRFEKDVPVPVSKEVGQKLLRESFMKEVREGVSLPKTPIEDPKTKTEEKRGKK